MQTQISKSHANVVAVPPRSTFPKEGRMKKHSSTTLTLAIFFAMVATMTLSAVAQEEIVGGPSSMYYNPNQVALKAWYLANEVIDFSTVYDWRAGPMPFLSHRPWHLTDLTCGFRMPATTPW